MILKGRRKIYTDVEDITKDNVIEVLLKALTEHEMNRGEIKFLLDFEKGIQPLRREKTTRPEIDIKSISNMANEITEFKLGYMWGNPVAIVQKSDKLPKGSDKNKDNSAISILNEMFYAESRESKDQQLGRYVEICGIGHQMIDVKRNPDEEDAPFDLITLNPLFTFVIYSSDVSRRKMMGVTYTVKSDMSRTFTCITNDAVYIIDTNFKIINGDKDQKKEIFNHGNRSGEANPIGEVYIIEYERSFDRTGCFERQIDELNALNILESDLCNDVAQMTQAIWWGNDIELEKNDDGSVKGVQGGQWILTRTTGQGNKPTINGLVLNYDYSGVLANIQSKHDYILERAYVPKQSDPGGGSTGTAMSMSSGWSAAESSACKESLVLKKSYQERNRLAIKVVRKSHNVQEDSEVQKLSWNDIDIRFTRQKTFDMATKVNSLATMINNMVNPRIAMEAIDFFPNLAEAIDDSVEKMEKYQENLLKSNESEQSKADKTMSDMSDQAQNSPVANI